MSLETDILNKRLARLEKNFTEQLKTYVKNDEELRKKINDQRITLQAAVCAMELSIAHRLSATVEVVMNMLPESMRPAALAKIEKIVAELPPTDELARLHAAKKYEQGEGDNY